MNDAIALVLEGTGWKAGARSGDRSGVLNAVRETNVTDGITGSFSILPSGDPSLGPITISVAKKSFVTVRGIDPGPRLVAAARRG